MLFVTNNALPTRDQVEAKLSRHGIEAGDDLITSPMAAASLIEPGERVLVCAGAGVVEALADRGVETVDAGVADPGPVDAVVVGLHLDFDYARLDVAARAARAGARLIATNDDTTYPGEHGLSPGAGSLLAAVVTASGVTPVIAGKPYPPMVDLVRAVAGRDGRGRGGSGRHRRPLRPGPGLPVRPGADRGHDRGRPAGGSGARRHRRRPGRAGGPGAGHVTRVRGHRSSGPSALGASRRSRRVAGMADNDFLSRSRDAGGEALQRAQDALEQLANQLTRASEQLNRDAESQRKQAQDLVSDLLERGRAASEQADGVGRVGAALAAVRVAKRPVPPRPPAGRAEPPGGGPGPVDQPARKAAVKRVTKRSTAKKAAAKKAPAKKAPAKKTAAKKAPAKKKAAAKKAPAKKSDGQEGGGQEGAGQAERGKQHGAADRSRPATRFRPAWWLPDVASTTSWFAASWRPRAPGPRPTSPPGRVLVGGAPATKAARLVHPGEAIVVAGSGPRYVSRAGVKLEAALDRFGVDVAGRRVLDAGASTGGFSDCVLQRGRAAGGGRRRRLRPAPRAGGRRPRVGCSIAPTCASLDPARSSARRSTSWWPTCRSSRCGWCSTPCWPCSLPTVTWSRWSSRSSKPAARSCPRARAS